MNSDATGEDASSAERMIGWISCHSRLDCQRKTPVTLSTATFQADGTRHRHCRTSLARERRHHGAAAFERRCYPQIERFYPNGFASVPWKPSLILSAAATVVTIHSISLAFFLVSRVLLSKDKQMVYSNE